MARLLAILLLATLVVACGKTNKRENIEPPTELVDLTPTANVSLAWQQSLGKGERHLNLRQEPASDGQRLYAADVSGKLQAFGLDSGASLWRIDTGLPLSSSLSVGEGTLVVGTLTGEVLAFNPDTGTERWRAKVSSEVLAAPAIGRGQAIVRSNDGRIFSFSITDGDRRWVYDHSTPGLTLRGNSSPILAEDLVLIGYDSGQVVALRGNDGLQLWEQTIAGGEGRTELERMVDIDGAMAYDNGEIFASAYNAQVMALSLNGGQPLWNREMSSYGGVVLADNVLYLSDRDGVLWALDRNSGAALWKQDALMHRWLTTPAVHGDLVAVGDLQGYVHWFDRATGTPAARQRLDKKPIRAAPQVRGDLLYAVSIDGKLGVYRH